MITHLLCVDPAQRYTIDEFLAHPWCNAAPAPPPPPTPFIYGNLKELGNRPLDSPLLSAARGGRGHDGRSPGIATLKEAFDITYAVHRMEEEGARRRKYNGRGGAGTRGFLSGLNEDDEDEEEYDGDSDSDGEENNQRMQDTPVRGAQPAAAAAPVGDQQQNSPNRSVMDGRAGPRDQGKGRLAPATGGVGATAKSRAGRTRGGRTGFELDMDNATLLGRRQGNKRVVGSSPLKMENLRMADGDLSMHSENVGSPMRL